jgi:D-alanyl-D-alanine carboxypeptidase/D-alanyl-D-alanine-endopeptidase (penicillin-binding protein 4)
MKPRLFNRSPVTLLVFFFLILALAASTRAIRKHETTRTEEKPAAAAPVAESKPVTAAANSPADGELARLIDQAIDQSEFSSARWGLIVISRSDGRTLYARNADRLFTPASNMKIYTTAVALDLLGANYQWRTSVYSASQPDGNSALNGDLILYGRGAPDLLSRPKKDETASLEKLADDLYQRGVRHINGNVIGDESYFRADPLGDGWQWNDVQWYFGAEPSALSIDDNEVDLQIEPSNNPNDPPVVKFSNAQDYVHLANNMATVKRGEQMTVGIHRGVSDNEVRVWGECPLGSRPFGARLSIHDPALRAARLFMDALRARGITVGGAAHTRDFRVPASERFDPSRAVELAYVSSKPLGEIVKATNKESINLNAELILRTLGRERGEIAPDTDSHKTHERGDDEAGLAVIKLWLNRAGIPTNTLALHDGSGLSRLDLVTPEATAHLLVAISKTASASIFQESLPIAGRDGTLKGRLRTFKDRVSAKTGSLTYDNSLSGFLTAADGEALVFSIMCNDQTGRASGTRLIDEIVAILANYPSAKAGNP